MDYSKTKLFSVLNNKCPRCHKGSFFQTDNPYNLKKFSRMNDRCAICSEDFRKEPGYYFGAAYVSYALTVAFGIGLYVLQAVLVDLETIPFLIMFSLLLLMLLPVWYRLARLIWINLFVNYHPYPEKTDTDL